MSKNIILMSKEESEKHVKNITKAYTDFAEGYYKNGFHTAEVICQKAKKDGLFNGLPEKSYNLFQSCAYIVVVKQKMKEKEIDEVD